MTEPDMTGRPSPDIKPCRIWPLAGIPVRSTEKQDDPLAFPDGLAAEFKVSGCSSEEGLNRRFETDDLFEGLTRESNIAA
jgi:hypothetical protein